MVDITAHRVKSVTLCREQMNNNNARTIRITSDDWRGEQYFEITLFGNTDDVAVLPKSGNFDDMARLHEPGVIRNDAPQDDAITEADAMDDFIRAVRAGNMPRTDEPYATVARHIMEDQRLVDELRKTERILTERARSEASAA